MLLDDVAAIAGEENEIAQAARRERVDDMLEIRPSGNVDHRLWQLTRQLAESRAEAAGEDRDLHRDFFTFRTFHNRRNVHFVLSHRCSVDVPTRSR